MSTINWFEIPVLDIHRAQQFYSRVLDTDIPIMDMTEQMGSMLGILSRGEGVSDVLVQNSQHGYVPSQEGILVYLTVGDVDLNKAVARVDDAGGKVTLPKTDLGEQRGYCAWILDTEGNKVGLYSGK